LNIHPCWRGAKQKFVLKAWFFAHHALNFKDCMHDALIRGGIMT